MSYALGSLAMLPTAFKMSKLKTKYNVLAQCKPESL